MSKVYVLFVKRFPAVGDTYAYLPTYEIHYQPKEGKVAELDPGDCVDVFRCELSEDKAATICYLYRISNIDGKAQEEYLETFTMAREGH